ncbi:MAG TPA: ABC transporter ATP-binding protein [bacterium]|jgi:branched-chain amino acid transport system ATP-binding protein|nr:ABC transporter ATP-binding protein [bacterium]
MDEAAVLQVSHLVTDRGRAHILRDVSLEVRADEVVCLVGRNGAGKTTTMDSLMGLLPVRGGAIRLHGQDITRLPAHARARRGIGYAPEDAGVFPDLTVDENLQIAQWLGTGGRPGNGEGTDSGTAKVFELFPELRGLRSRRALNLSGGEKKMVAIARAMLLRPSVMLLDEAFEGLAPAVVKRFAEAVTRIKAMGIALFIAESNIMTASRIAERLYVMDRGEILFEGTPQEAFANAEVVRTIRG